MKIEENPNSQFMLIKSFQIVQNRCCRRRRRYRCYLDAIVVAATAAAAFLLLLRIFNSHTGGIH